MSCVASFSFSFASSSFPAAKSRYAARSVANVCGNPAGWAACVPSGLTITVVGEVDVHLARRREVRIGNDGPDFGKFRAHRLGLLIGHGFAHDDNGLSGLGI